MTPDQVRTIIRQELTGLLASDRFIFQKHIQILDGKNIQLAQGTGTKIGTSATQKVGFFGATPVDQAAHISDPAGGTADTQARAAINSILDVLQDLGFMAS